MKKCKGDDDEATTFNPRLLRGGSVYKQKIAHEVESDEEEEKEEYVNFTEYMRT